MTDDLSHGYVLLAVAHRLPSLYLVGGMGSGKTTVGKLLARQLGRCFFDSDWHICAQTGIDIPWIFDKEGECGFRTRETRALEELTKKSNIVLATGGGAIESPHNRQLLKSGLVIYLDASVDTQLLRTKKDRARPLLQTENPRAVLETLRARRDPLYRGAADLVVPTGTLYPKQMAADILLKLYQLTSRDFLT